MTPADHANTLDPLDRMEAREIAAGPRFLSLWEQTALVNVARAARDVYKTKPIEVPEGAQKRWGALAAALARLEKR